MRSVLALALLVACGGAMDDAPEPKRPALAAKDLIPKHKRGWDQLDKAAKQATAAFADEYAAWLGDAKTPRRAVAGLATLARDRGAKLLDPDARPQHADGNTFYFTGSGGDAAAFVRIGARPIEEGLRIVVVSVDAPHLVLKQQPVFDKAGFAMLDLQPYGDPKLESWLARPMALYLYSADGPVDLVIGEDPDGPVLVVPDLLPHLSGKVQHKAIVDSPERMNAVAASSNEALLQFLAGHGVDEKVLVAAETSLVPAGPPIFVGVDRALLAGHGHAHRSLAYGAVRALFDADQLHQSAAVIIVSRSRAGDEGNSGTAFARTAMTRMLGAFADDGENLDVLAIRRIYMRSAALIAGALEGVANSGVILHPRADDALPAATRRVVDSFKASGAQYQISGKNPGWGHPSRDLATLDLDVVEIALPVKGVGTPLELMSTLDLYQGYVACRGWLSGQ